MYGSCRNCGKVGEMSIWNVTPYEVEWFCSIEHRAKYKGTVNGVDLSKAEPIVTAPAAYSYY